MSLINSVEQAIPIQSATRIDVNLQQQRVERDFAKELAFLNNPGPSAEDIAKQLEKQWNVEARVVFRQGNKVIGVLGEGGGFTSTNGAGAIAMQAVREANDKGLTGQQYEDYMAKRIGELLSARGGVQIQIYPPKSGVTVGMAEDEMFGRGPKVPSPQELAENNQNTILPSMKIQSLADLLSLYESLRDPDTDRTER